MTSNPIQSLPKIYSGKVRDLYDINEQHMLMVASDRLSTFDIILNQTIPNKGKYLTQISLFWFNKTQHIITNHLTDIPLNQYLNKTELDYANGRALIVKKLKPLPIEVIVRGYLAGSGYKDYLATGSIGGHKLPAGLQNSQKLPQTIFTPSTKAEVGDHDINISIAQCEKIIGVELTAKIEHIAISLYNYACELASSKNIIIADTKFEFGLDQNNNLVLMDEILTPDSSRFWDKDTYQIGSNPPSYDKQFVRDYLEKTIIWDKQPPIPDLPQDVIVNTQEIYHRLVNKFIE